MLTVLVPTHGRPDLLHRTLGSLAMADRPPTFRELIVIENGSRDGAEAVVLSQPHHLRASYLHHDQGNKSAALNRALDQVADDDLVVFLDDDVRVDPGFLNAYASGAAEHGRGYFFGGPFGVDYAVVPPDWLVLPPSARGWNLPGDARIVERPEFIGFNWAATAADLRKAGGFNPAVGPGGTSGARGQETEMQGRLLSAGLRGVYLPEAMVWHFVPEERSNIAWSLRRSYQNAVASGLAYDDDQAARIFGYPRWTLAPIVTTWLAAIGSGPRSVEKRYLAWRKHYMARGYADGARFAYRQKHRPRP